MSDRCGERVFSKKLIGVGVVGVLLVAGGVLVSRQHFSNAPNPETTRRTDVAETTLIKGAGAVSIGGPFLLEDHTGRTRSHLDFRGKYALVYFGYTYCPDICPTALYGLTDALERMGDKAKNFQTLFITVDPKRDTVPVLRGYLKHFHPSFVALTGTQEAVQKAMSAYHVHAAIPPQEAEKADYIMDHSSLIYVMDPRGRFITSFNHATPPEHMARVLLTLS